MRLPISRAAGKDSSRALMWWGEMLDRVEGWEEDLMDHDLVAAIGVDGVRDVVSGALRGVRAAGRRSVALSRGYEPVQPR